MNNLQRYRKLKKLTQYDLSKITNIPFDTIRNIENNTIIPLRKDAQKLSNALDIPFYKIFSVVEQER